MIYTKSTGLSHICLSDTVEVRTYLVEGTLASLALGNRDDGLILIGGLLQARRVTMVTIPNP